MPAGGVLSLATVDDPGRDVTLLAEREQPTAVDEVERLPAGELVTVRAVTGRRDHDSLGRALMLHRPPQVSHVGGLDGTGVQLGLDDELAAGDGVGVIGDAVDASVA